MIFVFVAIIRVFFVFNNFENYNTSKLFEINQINNVVFSDIIYEFTWITLHCNIVLLDPKTIL